MHYSIHKSSLTETSSILTTENIHNKTQQYSGNLLFQNYFLEKVKHYEEVTEIRSDDSNHEKEIQMLW
jgi:hypothetical protein